MNKQLLLAGIASTTLLFALSTSAKAQTCLGNEIRPLTCHDHQGNIITDTSLHRLCDQNGFRPSTTRGCSFTCPPPPDELDNGGDGGGDGDGDGDPLILDLDGNGASLINVDECVMFDIDNDGEVNQTGWVDPNDGLLVLDDNGNGIVDGQSELFGNSNVAAYENLVQHDENEDGVINSDDSVWDSLQVWVDGNSNGQTDAGELQSIDDLGIVEIDVGYSTAEEIREGNRVTATGTFTRIIEDVGRVVNEVIETFFDFFS